MTSSDHTKYENSSFSFTDKHLYILRTKWDTVKLLLKTKLSYRSWEPKSCPANAYQTLYIRCCAPHHGSRRTQGMPSKSSASSSEGSTRVLLVIILGRQFLKCQKEHKGYLWRLNAVHYFRPWRSQKGVTALLVFYSQHWGNVGLVLLGSHGSHDFWWQLLPWDVDWNDLTSLCEDTDIMGILFSLDF